MSRHASPTAFSRSAKRAAVAATAVAASATLTVAAPGAANAAILPPSIPGAGVIDGVLTQATTIPGTLPITVIGVTAPVLNTASSVWSSVPVLGSLVPFTNTVTPIQNVPTQYGNSNGATQVTSVGVPLLGGLTNTLNGVVYTSATGAVLGSAGSNTTIINGPLNSGIGATVGLSAITNPTTGVTTWTPQLGAQVVAPLGLGSAGVSVVPVQVSYGENSFGIAGPSVAGNFNVLGLVNGNLLVNVGSIAFQNGNLVITTPSFNGALTTALGGGTVAMTPGVITVGLGGISATGPVFTATANALGTEVLNASLNTGQASASLADGIDVVGPKLDAVVTSPVGNLGGNVHVSTGSASASLDEGIQITGPAGSAGVTTPLGSGEVHGATGSVDAGLGQGINVTAPSAGGSVTTPVASGSVDVTGGDYHAGLDGVSAEGVGYEATGTVGDTTVESSVIGHGSVTPEPSVTVGADIVQTVNGEGITASPEVTIP